MINILDDKFFNDFERKLSFLLKIFNCKDSDSIVYRHYGYFSLIHHGVKVYFTDISVSRNLNYITLVNVNKIVLVIHTFDFISHKDPRDLI